MNEIVEAFDEIITRHPKMISIFHYIQSVSLSSEPVLITGETGTGKELIAKAIHTHSKRQGPLITLNVAGLDDNVFSDTLFGHSKGAYTGADTVRNGMIEKAAGGTLFLDEIGDMSHVSQVKLLRLIQEGEFLPLGQDEMSHSNARIIACTNQNLWDMQRSGAFRKDLNFRLRTHHIDLPPLRQRKEDLPLLTDHFIKEAAKSLGRKTPSHRSELISRFLTYSFPGNIREMKALIFDAVSRNNSNMLTVKLFDNLNDNEPNAFNREVIPSVLFPDELPSIKDATGLLVDEALKRAKGNQSIAAKMLGISRQALGKRVREKKSENKEE